MRRLNRCRGSDSREQRARSQQTETQTDRREQLTPFQKQHFNVVFSMQLLHGNMFTTVGKTLNMWHLLYVQFITAHRTQDPIIIYTDNIYRHKTDYKFLISGFFQFIVLHSATNQYKLVFVSRLPFSCYSVFILLLLQHTNSHSSSFIHSFMHSYCCQHPTLQ